MEPTRRFSAVLALLALIFVAAVDGQNYLRQLRSQYLYAENMENDATGVRDGTFLLFYTPNLAAQTLDIAVATKTQGWIANGLSPLDIGNMVTPAGNQAVKGIYPNSVEQRTLNARSVGSTPLTDPVTYTNATVTVDGPYLVLQFTRPFTFTSTSRHTFLTSFKADTTHAFHAAGYHAIQNVQLATGDGLSNPPLCSPANCNGTMTCYEPFVCGPAQPVPPPVLPPTDASCNLDSFKFKSSLSDFYTFGYTVDETAKTISVGVEVPNDAVWTGFGIPKSSANLIMQEAEAVICNVNLNSPSAGAMGGFTLMGRDPSGFANINTDMALVPGSVCLAPSGKKICRFVRNLNGKSNPIATRGSIGVLGVIGRGTINYNGTGPISASEHGTAANQLSRSSVDLSTGGASAASAPPIQLAHASLMFIGWGCILQFGAFWARYAKKLPKVGGVPAWFFIHQYFQPAGYTIALAGFIIAIVMVQQAGSRHFSTAHHGCGLATMILGLIQIVIASFRPHPPNKDKGETEPTTIRRLWELKHWYIGRAALILTVITIFLGFGQIGAGVGFYAAYGAFVGVGVLLYIIFEIKRLMDPEKARGCY